MAKPITNATQYKSGDGLDADWVNEITRRVLRELSGGNAHGGSEGLTLGRERRPPCIDNEGVYEIPLTNTLSETKIPPYAVLMPLEQYNFNGYERRGIAVMKPYNNGDSTRYWAEMPICYVNGPFPIPANAGGGSSGFGHGRGSMLVLGGWVAVSKKDEDNNDFGSYSESTSPLGNQGFDLSWGPKPGSWLLWPRRNGFRVVSGILDYQDPFDTGEYDDMVGLAYAYQTQVIESPRAFSQGGVGALAMSNTSFSPIGPVLQSTDDSDAHDGDVTRWRRNLTSADSDFTMHESGAYLVTLNATATSVMNAAITGSNWASEFYELAPFVDGYQVGEPVRSYLGQIKDKDGNLVQLAMPASGSWLVNIKSGQTLKIYGRVSSTNVNQVDIGTGHITIQRFSGLAYKTT